MILMVLQNEFRCPTQARNTTEKLGIIMEDDFFFFYDNGTHFSQ